MSGPAKLLLPLQGAPLIAHTLIAWQAAGLAPLVVVRPGDGELAEACRLYGGEVLIPETPPPEMKASVQLALRYLRDRYHPPKDFAWLLAPADMPRLSAAIITRLLDDHQASVKRTASPPILVPTFATKRGHPVLFPWPFADQALRLGPNDSMKTLLARNQVREIACDDLLQKETDAFADVDTPADYQRLV